MEIGQRNIEGFLGSTKRERSLSISPIPKTSPGPSEYNPQVLLPPDDIKEWRCNRCEYSLPLDMDNLEEIKQEHEDYHYALELSEGMQTTPRGKKRKNEDIGIRAFFSPKKSSKS